MADISPTSSDHDPDPAAPPTTTRSTPSAQAQARASTPAPVQAQAQAQALALAAPTIIPQKRPYEGDIANPTSKRLVGPAIPLKPMLKLKPPREKKDSWKKKEAAAAAVAVTSGGAGGTGGTVVVVDGGINTVESILQELPPPGLQRWRLPKPQHADYEGARPPLVMLSNLPGADISCEFVSLSEHPKNRRGFRYYPCTASHILPLVSYRLSEVPPFTTRFAFEDMNPQVHITRSGTTITTEKGFRMARANVCAREGNWYYEAKILRGINSTSAPDAHVRVGWARREAPLEAPVGFDAYSYSLRDVEGQKVHCSRPSEFMSESIVAGDVIGLQICLPSLKSQREDLLANITTPSASAAAISILYSGDIIRDRIPIRYKNQLYFEQFEYQPTKELDEVLNPSTAPSSANSQKNSSIRSRTLQNSFIRIFKNGKLMGTPWTNLLHFLPPCSKPNSALGGRELDDGFLGYYPAVSVFRGGAVECNFGPEFLFPPEEGNLGPGGGEEGDIVMTDATDTTDLMPPLRPISDRYGEQIAEDIFYDLVDEVDCFFNTDPALLGLGGVGVGGGGKTGGRGSAEGGLGGEMDGDTTASGGQGGATEEIKEMEVEEE